MAVRPSGSVMDSRLVQFSKVEPGSIVIPAGKSTNVTPLPLKIPVPNVVTVSGRVICVRLSQPANAWPSMRVSPSSRSTRSSAAQPLNTYSGSWVIPPGMAISRRLEQFSKAEA